VLDDVLAGIEAAREVGLAPIKINTVVMGGINEDEIINFALLTKEAGWHVRFIELMPFVENGLRFVPVDEIRQQLATLGNLEECSPPRGNGPAKYYRLPGALGTLGFIHPVSEHFCFGCNRLRLTANGKLLPCLLSPREVDLLPELRGAASAQELIGLVQRAADFKPRGHDLAQRSATSGRRMPQMGG
jgi:cyclic pyranopterin phosphate synthase